MFDTDDIAEAKRMLPIYKRAVDLLETVSGKKTEQAEQEPVGIVSENVVDGVVEWLGWVPQVGTKLYAAPVRTKDLTDDEIEALFPKPWIELMTIKEFVRAVIAADREKNK